MTDCEYVSRCAGLSTHLSERPVLESLYRHKYCREEWSKCARFAVAVSGPMPIPDDLLPNQHDRLEALGVRALEAEPATAE